MINNPKHPIQAPLLQQQPVSVTRQMAAAFPRLTQMAAAKGLKLHHLGAGYPHPEVSDPSHINYMCSPERDEEKDKDSSKKTPENSTQYLFTCPLSEKKH